MANGLDPFLLFINESHRPFSVRKENTMRTRKAMKIVIANVISQLAVTLCGLILPRFMMQAYGSGISGLTNSIRQILTYMTIVGSGIGLSAMTALYAPIADKNQDKINGIMSATRLFFNKAGLIFCAASLALVVVYPLMVQGKADAMMAASLVLINATGTMIEFFVANKYRAFLTANQQFNVISNITTQGVLLNTAVSVLLIKLNVSVLIVQTVAMGIYVVRMIMIASYTKRHFPLLDFHVQPDHAALAQRWSAFSYQLSGMIITYSPIVIVTVFMSTMEEVNVFVVYNMVYLALNLMVMTFASGLPAGFGEIIARGHRKKLRRVFNTFETAFYMMAFVCFTCFAVLILPFIKVYTAGISDVHYVRLPLAIAFVAAGIARSLRSPHVTLVEAAGHFKQNRTLNLLEAGLNLTLSLVFVQFWGIVGVVCAMAVSALLRSIFYILYSSKRILRRGLWKTAKKLIGNFVASALSALPFFLWFPVTAAHFLQWFGFAGAVGGWTVFVFLVVNFVVDPPSIRDLYKRIRSLFKRKSTETL